MIWSFVLAAVGIAGIYLAGRKSKWGWGLGLFAQILWVVFALTTSQYGFILTAVAYGAVYGKNLYQWHREDKVLSPVPDGEDIPMNWVDRSTLENCYDEPLGDDGLTYTERKQYADRYAAGPGRGLDDKGRETIRRLKERHDEQS